MELLKAVGLIEYELMGHDEVEYRFTPKFREMLEASLRAVNDLEKALILTVIDAAGSVSLDDLALMVRALETLIYKVVEDDLGLGGEYAG